MTYCLTYKINGIDHIFRMPINQGDDASYVSSLIRKEFAIIPKLTAKIYGSDIQSTSLISQCVQGQDVVTFNTKPTNSDPNPKLEQYRQVIITPRYESTTTFIVFTTINFKSMIQGDKIKVDINTDTNQKTQEKIKEMLQKNYASEIKSSQSMRILLFLPGGIPFLQGTISDFTRTFPDFMPHLYAVVLFNPTITDDILYEKFNNICDISTEAKKALISPILDNNLDGMCEMASSLGYIQRNGENVVRMIYSLAKFCPFAPMICGLYSLASLGSPIGMTILQITAPLSILFLEMSKNLPNKTNLYSKATHFFTYFMDININTRIPCTEFIKPFYQIGFEDYFNNFIPEGMKDTIDSIVAFDPDFRDQDWIRFQLPSLTDEDLNSSMESTKSMSIYPTMALREIHRTAIFMGKNGPCLFVAASASKDKSKKDTIDYIDPVKGQVESGKYEIIAKEMTRDTRQSSNPESAVENEDQIDPKAVKQFVFVCVDKSGSMCINYYESINRFTAAQEFFVAFANHCYTFHTSSLYGSIMFEDDIEVRNPLNALVTDFINRMIIKGEEPDGCTAMFHAIAKAANIMIEANKNKDYPNAIYRIVVISDGLDNYSDYNEIADIANLLIQNKIRVDAILIARDIDARLVAITQATGGITVWPRTMQEGLELFDKEEFFNVDIRQFGEFATTHYDANKIQTFEREFNLSKLNNKIFVKQNTLNLDNEIVTKPAMAVAEFNKEQEEINSGKVEPTKSHSRQKRIIQELRKIIKEPNPDIQVFPLKNKVDFWRVLLKGPEGTPYANRWFYLTVDFPSNYPEHYPLIRFVNPPFHPNVTDQGRICLDLLDTAYFSNFAIKNLLEQVITLLVLPNFKDPVDSTRFSLDSDMDEFNRKVQDWNARNSRASPDDWKTNWKIEDDPNLSTEDLGKASVPQRFLCPLTNKILKEPVLSTTKVYYEKSAFVKYLKSTKNPCCVVKGTELNVEQNLNLQIDKVMQTQINEWVRANNFHEDDDENDDNEEAAISEYKRKVKNDGKERNKPKFSGVGENEKPVMSVRKDVNRSASKIPPRPRPKLPDI